MKYIEGCISRQRALEYVPQRDELVDELQAVADPPSVPEPSSYALLRVGMLGLAGVSAPKRLAAQKA